MKSKKIIIIASVQPNFAHLVISCYFLKSIKHINLLNIKLIKHYKIKHLTHLSAKSEDEEKKCLN